MAVLRLVEHCDNVKPRVAVESTELGFENWEGSNVVEAFVLVQTEVGKAGPIAELITDLDGVVSAEEVVGGYDVIVRTAADSEAELAIAIQAIQQVKGITRTLTCQVTTGLSAARTA